MSLFRPLSSHSPRVHDALTTLGFQTLQTAWGPGQFRATKSETHMLCQDCLEADLRDYYQTCSKPTVV